MVETEVKILGIDPEKIRKKLLELKAEKVFDGRMEAIAFDFPDKRLERKNGYLRLRKVGDKTELTYKESRKSVLFKKREEINTHVKDFGKTIRILRKLGLREINSYKKIRKSYKLKGIRFDIDIYPAETGIAPLVEIESAEENIKKGVEMLGFQMKDTSTASVWELLELNRLWRDKKCQK